jgi:DNA repair exonuclease SbcCD ATPase subunit
MKGPILACALAVLLAVPCAARGDSKAAWPALTKMLEVGWGTSSQAKNAGDEQVRAALAASGRAPQTLYAVAVVLIKQGRYAEAQKLIDEVVRADATHLPALRARVWLATMVKNYSATMLAAEDLADALPEKESANEDDESALREHVAFLGRIYGFLGGPASALVRLSERKAAERKLAERFSKARLAVFEEARDAVLQKYAELTDAKDAKTDAAKEAAEDAKAKTLEELAAQRQERADRLKELKERSDKLKGELKAELADVAKQDQPLVAELTRLERRSAAVNRELFRIQAEINAIQNLLDSERDATRRQLYISDLERLSTIGARYDADLTAINRLAAGVQSQRAVLAARKQQAEADFASQFDRINKESSEIAKREKRGDAMERRAERTTPSVPAAAVSLRATAGALATYEPFPVEEEKARILAEFK